MDKQTLQVQQEEEMITRDTVILLLDCKTLPNGDFIEIYDSTPFKIVSGHFVAKGTLYC
jgi:hypothetical protein